MVERTVYVGASRQVIVRLPIGAVIQVSVANTGSDEGHSQGTPVCVHVPADALAGAGVLRAAPARRAARLRGSGAVLDCPDVSVAELLEGKRVCVCGGSGGVGKTTTSAAIALGMAARGREGRGGHDRSGQAAGQRARARGARRTSRGGSSPSGSATRARRSPASCGR